MHGNDFQSWRNPADDALLQAVVRGIRSKDPNHIHTVELNYMTSGSFDDPTWAPLVEPNAAYTYFPTCAQVLTEYNRSEFKPIFHRGGEPSGKNQWQRRRLGSGT
jgi:hypothetical protein